jgi:hypothetical protein
MLVIEREPYALGYRKPQMAALDQVDHRSEGPQLAESATAQRMDPQPHLKEDDCITVYTYIQ